MAKSDKTKCLSTKDSFHKQNEKDINTFSMLTMLILSKPYLNSRIIFIYKVILDKLDGQGTFSNTPSSYYHQFVLSHCLPQGPVGNTNIYYAMYKSPFIKISYVTRMYTAIKRDRDEWHINLIKYTSILHLKKKVIRNNTK